MIVTIIITVYGVRRYSHGTLELYILAPYVQKEDQIILLRSHVAGAYARVLSHEKLGLQR